MLFFASFIFLRFVGADDDVDEKAKEVVVKRRVFTLIYTHICIETSLIMCGAERKKERERVRDTLL